MPPSTQAWPPLTERAAERHAPTALQRPVQARADWVDIAKGLGILLVVAGHTLDGLLSARLLGPDGAGARAFFLIYTFHMPVFFVLSGLFVQSRLRRDATGFARDAALRIAWPYFLWSTLQLAVIHALGSAVNEPARLDLHRIVSLVWEPTSQFWFLQSLLVLHLAALVLLPRLGPVALLLLALAARVLVELTALPIALEQVGRFAMFYALGVALGPLLAGRAAGAAADPAAPPPLLAPRTALALAVGAGLLWAVAAEAAYAARVGYWSVYALPAAVSGGLALVALALVARGAMADALRYLGRASMAIYLLHVLFAAGTRIVLSRRLGLDDPVLIGALAIAAGVAGPVLLREAALRLKATRVLGLG